MDIENLRKTIDEKIDSEDFEEAISLSEILINDHPTQISYNDWFEKGFCHFHLDQHEDAVDCYSRALEFEPSDFRTLSNIAISLLRLERDEESFQFFLKALKINPDIGPAWLNIGYHLLGNSAYYEDGYLKAVNAFRRAVKLVPDYNNGRIFDPQAQKDVRIGEVLESSKSLKNLELETILSLKVPGHLDFAG